MNALKSMMKATARVRRDGAESEIPAEQVVVGDVVLIAAGDEVPADGRIIAASALQIDESALTGALQMQKDERFWIVTAFMSIFHPRQHLPLVAALLRRCLGDVPHMDGLRNWEQALAPEQELSLYFEVSLPTLPAPAIPEVVDRQVPGESIEHIRRRHVDVLSGFAQEFVTYGTPAALSTVRLVSADVLIPLAH
jgi:hypothetical protein